MKRLLAEFIGTFALVFAGTGAIIVNQSTGHSSGETGIALVFGLVVMAMIYSLGPVSGAHLNPVVSLALALTKRFSWQNVSGYVVSQCLGAVAASGLLRWLFPDGSPFGATLPSDSISQSFAIELLISALLVLVVLSVSGKEAQRRGLDGLAIGATVTLAALLAGPVSGASMNPARSLAPAVMSGNFDHLWLYWLAPATGAVLAVALHCALTPGTCCPGTVHAKV